MRIACVHIPQFALQCVTRLDPSLRRAPVVVVGSGLDPGAGTVSRVALHSPIVHACSRAAWALGVRLGMTATAARALSPELRVVTADAQIEREAVRAIADVLLGAATAASTTAVDVGGRVGAGGAHLAMYCEVPIKTRGTSFGDRLIELLDELGLAARIGIADDRFTAWVAAAHGNAPTANRHADDSERLASTEGAFHHSDRGVVSVPRGGSAAFLAPRPLALLSITPEVLHMLDALGVRTLGEFAALPAPSVARPHVSAAGADYQALARGESGCTLRPYSPEASIREDIITSEALGAPVALAMLGGRLALRLAGRGRYAARLELVVTSDGAEPRVIAETLDDVTADPAELADLIGAALGDDIIRGARIRATITGEAITRTRGEALHEAGSTIDLLPSVLGVVLSSAGSPYDSAGSGSFASWQLVSPSPSMHSERRVARTRRSKQRRRMAPMAQSRLFKVDG